jgi:protoporphyrinogen/coproporphyrinogen III oxidase
VKYQKNRPIRVAILGAGISGLSCAWHLKKEGGDAVQITLLEKENRIGGWIASREIDGFFLNMGPALSEVPAEKTLLN